MRLACRGSAVGSLIRQCTPQGLQWQSRRTLSAAPRSSLLRPLEPHAELIDPPTFAKEYLEPARPGFFPGLIRSDSPYAWPAFQEWPEQEEGEETLQGLGLNEELRDVMVEVEIAPVGRGYGDAVADSSSSSWSKVNMPFGEPLAFCY